MFPDLIGQLWNVSVAMSKRTSISGRTPDSLYQTALSRIEIAYGCERGPDGESHSLISPVFGFKRPRRPPPEFTYQIIPSGATSKRRTVVTGSGSFTSVISSVSGLTLSRHGRALHETHRPPSRSNLMS